MKFLIVLLVAAVMVCQVFAGQVPIVQHIREERSSYGAPAQAYAAPAPALGPAKQYSYQSPAPTIPCGQALIFSCTPSVAQAPCAAAAPAYGGGY